MRASLTEGFLGEQCMQLRFESRGWGPGGGISHSAGFAIIFTSSNIVSSAGSLYGCAWRSCHLCAYRVGRVCTLRLPKGERLSLCMLTSLEGRGRGTLGHGVFPRAFDSHLPHAFRSMTTWSSLRSFLTDETFWIMLRFARCAPKGGLLSCSCLCGMDNILLLVSSSVCVSSPTQPLSTDWLHCVCSWQAPGPILIE